MVVTVYYCVTRGCGLVSQSCEVPRPDRQGDLDIDRWISIDKRKLEQHSKVPWDTVQCKAMRCTI